MAWVVLWPNMGVCLIRGTTGEHDQLIKANKTEMRKRGIECFALDTMMIMRWWDKYGFQSQYNIQTIWWLNEQQGSKYF